MTGQATSSRAPGRRLGALVWVVAAALAMPAPALGQARSAVRPSLTLTTAYDENPLLQAGGQPDLVLRLTPGLTATRDTARTSWFGTYTFDAQRHREHPTLNSPIARQHGAVEGRFLATPRATFDVGAAFDRTLTPSDLNLETALAVDPRRATRLSARAGAAVEVSRLTTVEASYEFVRDSLSNPDPLGVDTGLRIHQVELGIAREIDSRHELAWTYRGWRLDHSGLETTEPASTLSHAGLLSWTYRITPATTFIIGAGPRFDGDTVEADVEVAIERRATRGWQADVSYVRTQAPAIGVRDFVALERVLGAATYRSVARVETSVRAGIYRNVLSTSTVRVFRASADLTTPVSRTVSLLVSYGVDWQEGRPLAAMSPLAPPGAPGLFVPGLLSARGERLRRNVVMVGVVISTPSIIREPAAEDERRGRSRPQPRSPRNPQGGLR